jgi:Smg protein
MFEVLTFVYENYWHGDACPELAYLERKLSAVGFDSQEIKDALTWLNELNLAARGLQPAALAVPESSNPLPPARQTLTQSPHSMRVYTRAEQRHLGPQGLGFIVFLETAGVLTADMREIVLDRAMAAPADPLPLEDLKMIVLMVFWSLGIEPDALVLDELSEDSSQRVAH